jgi:ABC-type transport system involved in cytochrome c biogenesis permease component
MAAIVAVVAICAAIVIYLLPGMIAFHRHHHNCVAIFALDLFLGWTFLGWVLAFVWALTVVRPRDDWYRP